ncbi:DUF3563 family protein [Paraburkholderia solisilvae]|jgi:hypothetical protein|uniref:DUF3563 domain-containing protein n=1 Tax=Paraburkholderia solisilvae TaxID=624376 RepID=A0A6J5E2L3_9BURK|nr:DUF3563 family protein [Paraburkholderia solisilvae]CAB3759651.1 hypothetical protein LMG29739_03208 [Paraburkholderia solisilvae]
MIAYLLIKLSDWIEHAEQDRRDAYIAMAKDLAEIERRMVHLDANA